MLGGCTVRRREDAESRCSKLARAHRLEGHDGLFRSSTKKSRRVVGAPLKRRPDCDAAKRVLSFVWTCPSGGGM